MENLANPLLNPNPPSANQLGFVLVADEMNPNGGILARFPGFPAGQPLRIPSLGFTFYGATPSNTIYPTNIYSLEYDGFADFPQYPINLISDLNAFAGIYYVHNTYPAKSVGASPWLQHSATADVAGLHRCYQLLHVSPRRTGCRCWIRCERYRSSATPLPTCSSPI